MTKNEEAYVHFVSCSNDLNEAWRILHVIKGDIANPLVGAAFCYALVAYARPYVSSHGEHSATHKLDDKFIPEDDRALHRRLIGVRHKIHAHSDLTVREAKLYVTATPSGKWVGAVQNVIMGTEELSNIDAIISMIEGTLRSMYVEIQALEAALPVNS